MSTLFNSQQNININISYNLGGEKKSSDKPTGKKVVKSSKISATNVHSNYTQNKKPSVVQNKSKKRSDTYPNAVIDPNQLNQYVKIFKPKRKIIKNLQPPENQGERRFKTQNYNNDEINILKKRPETTSHKKQVSTCFFSKPSASQKSNHKHHKSMQNHFLKKQRYSNIFMNTSNLNSNQQGLINLIKNSSKPNKKPHNKSCMLYSLKRGILDQDNHILSTNISNPMMNSSNYGQARPQRPEKRKRVKSASAIMHKKQKLVDKFLNMNMSLLGSQMGGSQLVNIGELGQEDQRGKKENFQKMLKQFMSSLDIHIMKNMKADKAISKASFFGDESQRNQKQMNILSRFQIDENIVDYLTKTNKIPIQRLHVAATLIQRAWRKQIKKQVVSYYAPLFMRAIQNQNKMLEINQSDHECIEIDSVRFVKKQKYSISPIQNKQSEVQHSNGSNKSFESDQIREQKRQFQVPKQKSLNIAKYRELVDLKKKQRQQKQKHQYQVREKVEQYFQSISNQGSAQQQQTNSKQNSSEDFQFYQRPPKSKISNFHEVKAEFDEHNPKLNEHWNETNRLLSKNMQHQGTIDPKRVFQQLIKQSKLNRKWIQEDLQVQDAKDSMQQLEDQNFESKQQETLKQKFRSVDLSQANSNKGETIDIPPNSSALKDDQLDDYEEYNCKKYANPIADSLEQEIDTKACKPGCQEKQLQNNKLPFWDKQWFQKQIIREQNKNGVGMMKNYLDCGLDGFGLKINQQGNLVTQQVENQYFSISHRREVTNKNQIQAPKTSINQFLDKEKPEDQDFLRKKEEQQQLQQKNAQFQLQKKQMQMIGKEPSYFPYSSAFQDEQQQSFEEQQDQPFEQNKNKVNLLVQFIIEDLMNKLSSDIAKILQKSSSRSFMGRSSEPQSRQASNLVSESHSIQVRPRKGIQTDFKAVKQYLVKLKSYILSQSNQKISYRQKVLSNLNKVIGPSSLQILSYLRITDENQFEDYYDLSNDGEQEQDHIYVVPTYIFNEFQDKLISQIKQEDRSHQDKMKGFKNFFHRAIFQAYNQCLDYEKPYGIAGRPYQWATQTRMHRTVKQKQFQESLDSAIGRLLESNTQLSGIIFDKEDTPFYSSMIQQEYKQQINQQRLSRMLANQLFQTEETWVNYNDEIAELLVQLSRVIEDKLLFQISTDLKKISRRRKILMFHSKAAQNDEQQIQIE